ncbi:DUF6173 family protein [Desulfosporosinus sp. FKA]|uniref:DUF6173 family protein n=1 Tax=Desulfosporosinus sp. FKA TaxID=1969834 RepID=UPI001A9A317E|nr:DUF6173 family protein [Desulfosporosinus sp. FKA]
MSFGLDPQTLKQIQSQVDAVKRATQGIDLQSISKRIDEVNSYKNPAFQLPALTNPNLASEFHMRLIKMINDFDEKLNQTEEVGVRLVTFGQSITFSVEDIGYWNPSLIRFYGQLEDGTPVELVQHVTQISFLLMALKRKNPDEPKRKIGFRSEEENGETQE